MGESFPEEDDGDEESMTRLKLKRKTSIDFIASEYKGKRGLVMFHYSHFGFSPVKIPHHDFRGGKKALLFGT
jgi:hypothetical protein